MIREAGANEIIFVTLLSLFQQQIWIGDSSGQMPQIEQLRLTPRATPGATPRATPKMMYYDACPTQTAARSGEGGDTPKRELSKGLKGLQKKRTTKFAEDAEGKLDAEGGEEG